VLYGWRLGKGKAAAIELVDGIEDNLGRSSPRMDCGVGVEH